MRTPLRELGVELPRDVAGPEVIAGSDEFAALNFGWLRAGRVTGLVPTMGALHRGHLSLVRRARAECDRVSVSIFVNPLQFGAGEDFAAYPRDLDSDLAALADEGVDAVFAPEPDQLYPSGFCSRVEVGAAAVGMEGSARPGHFSGVATVVGKLLGLARPHFAYFGQKDAQQLAVVRRMVADLGLCCVIRPCPIVREDDGLALSSRNAYLSAADRSASSVLYRALCRARELHAAGERDAEALRAAARAVLDAEPRCRVDYLELRAADDLLPLGDGPVERACLLVAARFGSDGPRETRLLDNIALGGEAE